MSAHFHLNLQHGAEHPHDAHHLAEAAVAVVAAVAVGVAAARMIEARPESTNAPLANEVVENGAVATPTESMRITLNVPATTAAVSSDAIAVRAPETSPLAAPDVSPLAAPALGGVVAETTASLADEVAAADAAAANAAVATAQPVTVTHTLYTPEGMTITLITLLDVNGAVVGAGQPVDGEIRFDGLPEGSYWVVYKAETGVITHDNGAAISAAVATPAGPVYVSSGSSLLILSR